MALTHATCSAQKGESEGEEEDDREETEHFFVTQATDVPGCEFVLPDDEKRTAAAGSRETSPAAQRRPDVPLEAGGIQTAVRMLEHALEHLNVLREPKPEVDRIQMRRREKRQPAERRVTEMIREIRESTTVTDVPLRVAVPPTAFHTSTSAAPRLSTATVRTALAGSSFRGESTLCPERLFLYPPPHRVWLPPALLPERKPNGRHAASVYNRSPRRRPEPFVSKTVGGALNRKRKAAVTSVSFEMLSRREHAIGGAVSENDTNWEL
ncbi:hypothetical protein EYF80_052278 [Liparis tanakae]|uniref:Uncharacterized protein n=1 Tax=Liparis tanakae TaxID=230148 RepID=A0A4Z2F8T9_9TELE|nr:hypothetical protein EYF80_052278 [Liparis tanakae]